MAGAFASARETAVRYRIEALILVLLALTVAAIAFQDRLLTRTIAITPQSHPTPAVYSDGDMGGSTSVALSAHRPLQWRCELKLKFAYPYCGYELLTDPMLFARGIDLSKYQTATISLSYDGPSDGLSLYLKNYDPRYSTPGKGVSNKFNRIDFRAAHGASEVTLNLRDARVADWWLAAHPMPPALKGPQFDNIVSIALQTADGARPGTYRFALSRIVLRRTLITEGQFYLGLLAFWGAVFLLFLFTRVRDQKRDWEQRLAERQQAETALRESNARAYDMLDSIPQIIWEGDRKGRCTYLSPQWYEFTGRPHGDGLGFRWLDMVCPLDVERIRELWRECLRSGGTFEAEMRLLHRDGGHRWCLVRGIPYRGDDGIVAKWFATCTDVNDRVMTQEALGESESLNRSIFEASPDSIVLLDLQGRILDTNPAAEHANAAGTGLAVGASWAVRFIAADHAKVQAALASARQGEVGRFTVRDAKGSGRWWDVLVAPLRDAGGCPIKLVSIARDVTEQKQAEEHAYWIANHDGLTGLPNRNLMQQKLDRAVQEAAEAGTKFALLLVDVDEFKRVNDTVGHDGGDALLCTFAARLKGAIRADDAVFRLGGDEFALLLTGAASARDIHLFADALYDRLREPCIHGGRMLDLNASMGAALFPCHGRSRTELMKNADIALYAAKAAGRRKLKLFAPAMRDEVQKRGSMLALARTALEEGRVAPYYQPQVRLDTGAVFGFEALLRWRHPQRGLQLPSTISAAFEDSNLAADISDAVIDRAIADIARWQDRGVEFGHVAINAAAAEFRREDFADSLLERLHKAGVPPQRIQIEVTETVFLGRGAEYVERALKRLSDAGMKIALDDFGTGFASLSHLQQFPVDTIKIDRRFVKGLGGRTGNYAIIDAVLSLGRSLGMEVVAEGIETTQQEQALLRLGCEYGQGFLYSRAVPARLVPSLLSKTAPACPAAAAA
ncbi:MAG TPA: EAL domain-containing protein [Allosphingosinicella sp.]|jgi:diguanylate cyclase (GGDEF)-like protein/PAS domain S-box-containing protein|nr:EAL domain-containing protein [Allosphingosinicella sp.]